MNATHQALSLLLIFQLAAAQAQPPQDDPLSKSALLLQQSQRLLLSDLNVLPIKSMPAPPPPAKLKLEGTTWGYGTSAYCTFHEDGRFEHINLYNDRQRAKGTWRYTSDTSISATASYPGRVNQEHPFKISLSGSIVDKRIHGKLNYDAKRWGFPGESESKDVSYSLLK